MRTLPTRHDSELDDVFDLVAGYFSLLAEPMRLKIMRTICDEERSVNDIVEAIGATQTNVSRHLALMLRGGLVTRRRDGNQVYYRMGDPMMMELCRSVCTRIVAQMDEREPMRRQLLKLAPRRRRAA